MSGRNTSSWQMHHIFPQSQFSNFRPETVRIGANLNSPINVIYMPSSNMLAGRLDISPHTGGHLSSYMGITGTIGSSLRDHLSSNQFSTESIIRSRIAYNLALEEMRMGLQNGTLYTNANSLIEPSRAFWNDLNRQWFSNASFMQSEAQVFRSGIEPVGESGRASGAAWKIGGALAVAGIASATWAGYALDGYTWGPNTLNSIGSEIALTALGLAGNVPVAVLALTAASIGPAAAATLDDLRQRQAMTRMAEQARIYQTVFEPNQPLPGSIRVSSADPMDRTMFEDGSDNTLGFYAHPFASAPAGLPGFPNLQSVTQTSQLWANSPGSTDSNSSGRSSDGVTLNLPYFAQQNLSGLSTERPAPDPLRPYEVATPFAAARRKRHRTQQRIAPPWKFNLSAPAKRGGFCGGVNRERIASSDFLRSLTPDTLFNHSGILAKLT